MKIVTIIIGMIMLFMLIWYVYILMKGGKE